MNKIYNELLEWNYKHGHKIPDKNIAKGLVNWLRNNESDYNGKWGTLDLDYDLNRKLGYFLQEANLKINDLKRIARDRFRRQKVIEEIESHGVKVEGYGSKISLYDLNLHGGEIKEKELSVINEFINIVKREERININILQPVVTIHRDYASREVDFGVSKIKFAELLEKFHDMILKSGIKVATRELPELKTYSID
ncbi:hypothetical protein LLY41_14340 [Cytobacillus firmus]|uniref:hypothetical protein n=1 Tax=Cytobacillus firmus TaxID=1399 RepID=UPI002187D9CD|nr:hypothetical protein [Cytobacillus firmus]URM31597.1 hypothetical protein LLY41_14340 [Cytobacillus firmus]